MAVINVNVTLDAQSGSLTLDPLEITLGAGDQVQWHFPEIPHCLPFIFFPQHTGQEFKPLGPFQFLEPYNSGVLGIGNIGVHHEFSYVALILDQNGAVATSAGTTALIRNPTAPEDTSPDGLVVYDQTAPCPLQVTPDPIFLERGRTLIWYIERIPADHFVTFHFDDFTDDPMKGPFVSFSFSRGFGGSWLASGEDFLNTHQFSDASPIPAQIRYHVRLRNALGVVVAQDDPVIAPLESPPGG